MQRSNQTAIIKYFLEIASGLKAICDNPQADRRSFFINQMDLVNKVENNAKFPALMLSDQTPQPADNGADDYRLRRRMSFTVVLDMVDFHDEYEKQEKLDQSEAIIQTILGKMHTDGQELEHLLHRRFKITEVEPFTIFEMDEHRLIGYEVFYFLNDHLDLSYNEEEWN